MNLKNYKVIKTEDGSETLYSKLYNEACHSLSGAKEETFTHYIKGCEVEKIESPIIFEVGFGTGLGYEVTKENLTNFKFYSTEIDEDLIHNYSKEFKTTEYNGMNVYTLDNLTIFAGDAIQNMPNIKSYLKDTKVNAIYQDAFSPKRNARLWSTEWFVFLKEISAIDTIMSTYSASNSIRKSMISAGWKLYAGVKFGKKRTSTRARLTGDTESAILENISRSPAIEITLSNADEYMEEK